MGYSSMMRLHISLLRVVTCGFDSRPFLSYDWNYHSFISYLRCYNGTGGDIMKKRDPNWRWLRALGSKRVPDKTKYKRKRKHRYVDK